MYLHLGNGKYVKRSSVLGIFDMDTATVCVATRRFLSRKEKEGEVVSADGELPKSFLLLSDRTVASTAKNRKGRGIKKKGEEKESVLLSKFSSGVIFGRTALTEVTEAVGNENG